MYEQDYIAACGSKSSWFSSRAAPHIGAWFLVIDKRWIVTFAWVAFSFLIIPRIPLLVRYIRTSAAYLAIARLMSIIAGTPLRLWRCVGRVILIIAGAPFKLWRCFKEVMSSLVGALLWFLRCVGKVSLPGKSHHPSSSLHIGDNVDRNPSLIWKSPSSSVLLSLLSTAGSLHSSGWPRIWVRGRFFPPIPLPRCSPPPDLLLDIPPPLFI